MITFGTQSSSTKSSSTPTRMNMWNSWQEDLFGQMANQAYTGLTKGAPSYPRTMYVPRTPEEQQFFNLSTPEAYNLPGRQAALTQVLSGKPNYEVGPEWANQYYEQAIRPIAMREWEETTLPQIRESFAGPGYWGSERARTETKAARDLSTDLTAQKSKLMYDEELARRQAFESAANRQASTALQAEQAALEGIGSAGQYSRMIEQERVLADLQRWLAGETVDGVTPTQYNPYLAIALSLMGLNQYQLGYNQSQSGGSSGFSGGISLAGLPGGGKS